MCEEHNEKLHSVRKEISSEFKSDKDKSNFDRIGRWMRFNTAREVFNRSKNMLIFEQAIKVRDIKYFEEYKIVTATQNEIEAFVTFKKFINMFKLFPEDKQNKYWQLAEQIIESIHNVDKKHKN